MRFFVTSIAAFIVAATLLAVQQAPPDKQAPPKPQTAQQKPDQPAGQQPAQRPPTFRAESALVRVDVYPTQNGQQVGDLKPEDFEVLEDGVPQKLVSFEHVLVRSRGETPTVTGAEPSTVAESNRMAREARNRLFVVFFDTYHVTDPSSVHGGSLVTGSTPKGPVKRLLGPDRFARSLADFLDKTVGADDMIAAFTPDMDPRALTFTRRTGAIEDFLATQWGRRFDPNALDPEEKECFPPIAAEQGEAYAQELLDRRREEKTLESLRTLVERLRQLREERKAVLVVSEGWSLFRPDDRLATQRANRGGTDVFVGPGGKIMAGDDPRFGYRTSSCKALFNHLASIDDDSEFRYLLDAANRANTSFYTMDPRGLAAWDTPIDARVQRGAIADAGQLHDRLDTLRTMAGATDGMALVSSNDFNASLKRITDDLSQYYLLGYYSTNGKNDGKFRKITVRVRRPGVQVRARRGYRAMTADEAAAVAAASRGPAKVDPETATMRRELGLLDAIRRDRAFRVDAGYGWRGSSGGEQTPVVWVVGELDQAASGGPEWLEGGEATVTLASGDRTIAEQQMPLTRVKRTFVTVLPADGPLPAGDYSVRIAIRPKSVAAESAAKAPEVKETVTVQVPAAPTDAAPGEALLRRRGPFTGVGYQPTADARLRRQERVRVDVPVSGRFDEVRASLLDRTGKTLPLPVTRSETTEGGSQWQSAEVTLAPLTVGDYVMQFEFVKGSKTEKVIKAFRIVP